MSLPRLFGRTGGGAGARHKQPRAIERSLRCSRSLTRTLSHAIIAKRVDRRDAECG